MSKIPKFESKLPLRNPEQDTPTALPVIKQRPYLRRSKSFDNTASTFPSSRKPIINSSLKTLTNSLKTSTNSLKTSTNTITSRLRFVKHQSVDECPELPNMKKPVRMNLRRSKSVSDIRIPNSNRNLVTSVNTNKIASSVNLKTVQSGSNKILKTGNTISRTNTARHVAKPNVIKTGTKRAGDTFESEVKNKVIKKSKVPDWDYKTRFNLLQEKFDTLQKGYKDADSEMASLKSSEAHWKEQAISLKKNNEEMSRQIENLQNKYQQTCSEIVALKSSEAQWKEQAISLKKNEEEIIKQNEDLQNKYQQISSELEHLKKESSTLKIKYDKSYEESQNLSKEREYLLNEVYNGEKLRRKLHNCIQDLKGNIRVFCRLRPALNEHEEINMCNFNFTNDNAIEISKDRASIAPGVNIKCNEPQEFTFDKVFNQHSSQSEIFDELSQLIQSAMDGYHVCVFAYGQTGSGKTYTMQGEPNPTERLGMIPRSVQLIFDRKKDMEKMGWSYTIKASFLEIYNEIIRDLLNMNGSKSLDVKYNEGKGTTVTNLTVMSISSAQELMDYMLKSQQNRSTAVTNFNEHSSRSHAVTKIYIEAQYKDSEEVYVGSVSLVDLAGSESAKSVSNARLAETKNINKSLSSLGNVMMALYKKESHIPYRNSKLTFLLQSSLGGNCKCLMIVNISPINDSYNESVNALRFAAKVKEVKISSIKNKLLLTTSK